VQFFAPHDRIKGQNNGTEYKDEVSLNNVKVSKCLRELVLILKL